MKLLFLRIWYIIIGLILIILCITYPLLAVIYYIITGEEDYLLIKLRNYHENLQEKLK